MFYAPFAVSFIFFIGGPVLFSLYMSLTNIQTKNLRAPFNVDFTGIANYITILGDPLFVQSMVNTGYFVVIGVPVTLAVGLALAVVLDAGIRRLKGLYRGVFYAPVVTNIVAVAVIWQYAFGSHGPINNFLGTIGLAGPDWLHDTHFAMPVVILLGVWRNFGTAMVLFLAGLQSIPPGLYEAAALDGAGSLRKFFSVTWPLLRPTTLLVSVLLSIFFLQVFEEPFLLTKGGPLGTTQSVALYTYDQFGFGNLGVSAASSYVLVVIVVIVSIVQFRLLRSKT